MIAVDIVSVFSQYQDCFDIKNITLITVGAINLIITVRACIHINVDTLENIKTVRAVLGRAETCFLSDMLPDIWPTGYPVGYRISGQAEWAEYPVLP